VVVNRNNVGQKKKMSRVEYKYTIHNELIAYLNPQLGDFIVHNHVSQWPKKEFKYYLQHIPQNIIVSCIDFSENYAFKVQNEIQDMHWFSF
jgi:hypothetical protein